MLQYVFKPSDLSRDAWPSGELRLEGIDKTENPDEADIFVLPAALSNFASDPDALGKLPFIKGKEDRLVCFDVSDYETMFPAVRDAILIRCNTRTWYFDKHPTTISWAWPVEDYAECVDVPEGGFKFDVSFQGWLSSDARKTAVASCNVPWLKRDIAGYDNFCGYIYHEPEGVRRRAEFRRSMRESRVCLCPESIPGVFPYRFFESLSAGRVPILICSGHVFPFADRIPYSEFIVEIASENAHLAGKAVEDFISKHSDEQIIEMGRKARHYWKAYLDSHDWPRTMAMAVREKLQTVNA